MACVIVEACVRTKCESSDEIYSSFFIGYFHSGCCLCTGSYGSGHVKLP